MVPDTEEAPPSPAAAAAVLARPSWGRMHLPLLENLGEPSQGPGTGCSCFLTQCLVFVL